MTPAQGTPLSAQESSSLGWGTNTALGGAKAGAVPGADGMAMPRDLGVMAPQPLPPLLCSPGAEPPAQHVDAQGPEHPSLAQ